MPGEHLGAGKAEVRHHKLVVHVDPLATAPFALERFRGGLGEIGEVHQAGGAIRLLDLEAAPTVDHAVAEHRSGHQAVEGILGRPRLDLVEERHRVKDRGGGLVDGPPQRVERQVRGFDLPPRIIPEIKLELGPSQAGIVALQTGPLTSLNSKLSKNTPTGHQSENNPLMMEFNMLRYYFGCIQYYLLLLII